MTSQNGVVILPLPLRTSRIRSYCTSTNHQLPAPNKYGHSPAIMAYGRPAVPYSALTIVGLMSKIIAFDQNLPKSLQAEHPVAAEGEVDHSDEAAAEEAEVTAVVVVEVSFTHRPY